MFKCHLCRFLNILIIPTRPTKKRPPRFELRSVGSESQALTIRPFILLRISRVVSQSSANQLCSACVNSNSFIVRYWTSWSFSPSGELWPCLDIEFWVTNKNMEKQGVFPNGWITWQDSLWNLPWNLLRISPSNTEEPVKTTKIYLLWVFFQPLDKAEWQVIRVVKVIYC